jgi:hypothetical protein
MCVTEDARRCELFSLKLRWRVSNSSCANRAPRVAKTDAHCPCHNRDR